MGWVQIVIGRSGTEMLSIEAGEVTRFFTKFYLQSLILYFSRVSDSYFPTFPLQLHSLFFLIFFGS